MIEKKDLNTLINNPKILDNISLDKIEQLVKKYPYSNLAHIILAKKLQSSRVEINKEQLYKISLNIPDRNKLFSLINGALLVDPKKGKFTQLKKVKTTVTEKKPVEQEIIQEKNSLIAESKKVVVPAPKRESSTIKKEISEPLKDEILEYEKPKSRPIEHEIELSLKGHTDKQLIADFLNENMTTKETKESFEKPDPFESFDPEGSFLTETLANIYIKQKKYLRAIGIFKGLIKKFPEKKVYFANKIKEIENLI